MRHFNEIKDFRLKIKGLFTTYNLQLKSMKVIILMGPPGAGKGTQAELLSERLGLYYLETSKVLEEKFRKAQEEEYVEVEGKKYDLLEEKKLWETGVLCSPLFVLHLVKNKIKELFRSGENLLLAGSPRTLPEGKGLVPFMKKLLGPENIKIIFIDIKAEETIWRNSHRRICELMRHPILYSKETAKLKRCPLDGSKLVRRKGLDDPETIKVRLKEYKERTLPLIDYFKKQGLKVKEVDGSPSPADVFEDILKALK